MNVLATPNFPSQHTSAITCTKSGPTWERAQRCLLGTNFGAYKGGWKMTIGPFRLFRGVGLVEQLCQLSTFLFHSLTDCQQKQACSSSSFFRPRGDDGSFYWWWGDPGISKGFWWWRGIQQQRVHLAAETFGSGDVLATLRFVGWGFAERFFFCQW